MINTETNLDACFELPQTYLSELASYCCHLCSLFCPESTLNMRCCKSEIYICFYSVYNWVFLLTKGYFYPILVTAIIFILFLWQQSFLSYSCDSNHFYPIALVVNETKMQQCIWNWTPLLLIVYIWLFGWFMVVVSFIYSIVDWVHILCYG